MVTLIAAEDSSVAGVISFYGVYDFPEMVSDATTRSLLVRLFRRRVLDDESGGGAAGAFAAAPRAQGHAAAALL